MGRIADEIIKEVRDRVDIVDLIGRHLTLKKSGRNHVGLCPFHGEKTPSFNVNSDRQGYYCFGCNEGGNVFTFLMQVENLTFPEAVRTLARECGIEVPESSGGGRSNTEMLYRANEVAQARYRKALLVPGNPGLAYLEARGLSAGAVEKFQLGYAPDSWDAVTNALRDEGISPEIGAQVGLLAERRSGGHYDRLRDRVTFTIRDVRRIRHPVSRNDGKRPIAPVITRTSSLSMTQGICRPIDPAARSHRMCCIVNTRSLIAQSSRRLEISSALLVKTAMCCWSSRSSSRCRSAMLHP